MARDAAFEELTTGEEKRRRLRRKNRHNLRTALLFLGVRLVDAHVGMVVLYTAVDLYPRCGPIVAPAAIVAGLLFTMAFHITVERSVTCFRPLTPQFCSLLQPYFWGHERLWKLSPGAFMSLFNGTPMKGLLWRALGVRIGRRVFDDGCGMPEKSLVTIGDDVTVNAGTVVQAHSLEDGAFKSDHIVIGAGATIGPKAFVHYGVTVGENSVLDADSFLMKGTETTPASRWRGNPATEVSSTPAVTATSKPAVSASAAPARIVTHAVPTMRAVPADRGADTPRARTTRPAAAASVPRRRPTVPPANEPAVASAAGRLRHGSMTASRPTTMVPTGPPRTTVQRIVRPAEQAKPAREVAAPGPAAYVAGRAAGAVRPAGGLFAPSHQRGGFPQTPMGAPHRSPSRRQVRPVPEAPAAQHAGPASQRNDGNVEATVRIAGAASGDVGATSVMRREPVDSRAEVTRRVTPGPPPSTDWARRVL